MAINTIGTQFSNPQNGDSAHLSEIIDAAGRVVRDSLVDYATIIIHSQVPERLEEVWPEWICYLDEEGMGIKTIATPQGSMWGQVRWTGNEIYSYTLEGFLALGNRAEELPQLHNQSINWGELLDLAFVNNISLDGKVKQCFATRAHWGHLEWSEDITYFGWKITLVVIAEKNRRYRG